MIKKILETTKKVQYVRQLLPLLDNNINTAIIYTNLCLWFEMLNTDEFIKPLSAKDGIHLLSWEQELGIKEKTFLNSFLDIGKTFNSEQEFLDNTDYKKPFYMYKDDKGIPHWIINRPLVEKTLNSIWSFSPYLNLSGEAIEPTPKRRVLTKTNSTEYLNTVLANIEKINTFKDNPDWEAIQQIAKESYKTGIHKNKQGSFNMTQMENLLDRCIKWNLDKQNYYKEGIEKDTLKKVELLKITEVNIKNSFRTFAQSKDVILFFEEESHKPETELKTINTDNLNNNF